VAVTEGSGKNFHTITTSIGGTAKEDQVVVIGEHYLPTYSMNGTAIATTTSASHLFALEADGTNYIRVHRIFVATSDDVPASAALAQLQVFRTTTASTTGTALNPRPFNGADTNPFAGRAVSIPGAKGTEGNMLLQGRVLFGTSATALKPDTWEWVARLDQQPIIVGPATTDGIVLKIVTGIASAALDYTVEFTVSSFV
jgi:hypothetical protein